jgi:hypothetical protein
VNSCTVAQPGQLVLGNVLTTEKDLRNVSQLIQTTANEDAA